MPVRFLTTSPDWLALLPTPAVLNPEQTQFLKELVGPVSRFFEVRSALEGRGLGQMVRSLQRLLGGS